MDKKDTHKQLSTSEVRGGMILHSWTFFCCYDNLIAYVVVATTRIGVGVLHQEFTLDTAYADMTNAGMATIQRPQIESADKYKRHISSAIIFKIWSSVHHVTVDECSRQHVFSRMPRNVQELWHWSLRNRSETRHNPSRALPYRMPTRTHTPVLFPFAPVLLVCDSAKIVRPHIL